MKRLTPRYRRWLLHRQRSTKSHRRDRDTLIHTIAREGSIRYARVGGTRFDVPADFCLDSNRDEMLAFLSDFRKRMSLPKKGWIPLPKSSGARTANIRGYYDFAAIQRITPAAALVFASEYDRVGRLSDAPRPLYAIDIDKWNKDVLRTLRDIGFLSLLGIELPIPVAGDGRFLVLRFRSNTKVVSTEVGGEGSLLADLFAAIGGDASLRLNLYTAILEAMQNVIDHAYADQFFRGVRHVRAWWLSGAADLVNRELNIALYDQGITIPVSLPYRRGASQIKEAFGSLFGLQYDPSDTKFDGQAIEAAVQLSTTSTGKEYHGKGLSTMRDVVTACSKGHLRIVSRYGEYQVRAGGATSVELLTVPLRGTLVQITAAF
jgi:hypothetical protein